MSTNGFSGARAIFSINGKKVAFASGCDGDEEAMYEPLDVLDNIEVEEHVPVGYRVSFSAEIFMTIPGTPDARAPREGVYGSLKQLGVFPKPGTDPLGFLLGGEMVCTIRDRITNKIITQVEGCKASRKGFRITARGVVGENVSFVAKRLKDYSEI